MLYPFTLLPTAILIGVSDLVGALAKVSVGDIASYGLTVDSLIITPFDILFNKIPLVDVNFFNMSGVSGTILQFRQAVAGWYYTMRLIASMVLLVILIYIGIRMALTSIATEKAMYNKMLVDWITSLALLFLLHYIMLFVFAVNEALVNAMATIAEGTTTSVGVSAFGTAATTATVGSMNTYDAMMTTLQLLMFHWDIVVRLTAIIIFGMLVFQTISFLIAYVKRMFTIGFLIIIAPLITITYSMDKIGDGKAQALNTWLKEFIYNILLQPFQCILYLVFAKLTFDAMLGMGTTFVNFNESNVGTAIFAILSLHFVKEGEKIVKKIFGFDKASTAGDLAVGAALTAGAVMKGGDIAKKYGGSIMKGKNMIASSKAAQTFKDKLGSAGTRVGKIADKVADTAKETKAGQYISQKHEKHKANREERLSKKAEALEQKIEQRAQQRWEKDGKKGNVATTDSKEAKEYLDKARKELTPKAKDGSKHKISGAKGGLEGLYDKAANKLYNSSSATGQALGGLYKYAQDHRKDIAGATIGMLGTGVGLAAGDFGDFSKALAGYNMGKGFTQGIYANSGKELKAQTDGASQLYANMTGDGNAASQLASAQLADMNDIKKSINEALKELKRAMTAHGIKNTTPAIGKFNELALDKNQAGTLNEAWISEKLTESGFKGTDEEKSEVIDKFKEYGALLASQSLASNIHSAEGMGIDKDYLAEMMGNKTAVTGYEEKSSRVDYIDEPKFDAEEQETIVEGSQAEVQIPMEQISSILSKALESKEGSGGVDITNLEETNAKIRELNAALERYQAADEATKDEILREISANNQNIRTHEDLVTNVEQQINTLQSSINQGE